jgi:Zn-dependent peptidase ImmA (M78 family)/transcriptional regulator with XRE-family HTH domain
MSPSQYDPRLLRAVFGEGDGPTPLEWARMSSRRFVRGLDLLTFDESERAKGRRLSALEALEAYGFETLGRVATEGSAIISESTTAVGRVLRERREDLGLTIRSVASASGLRVELIEALEASKRRPIREYERVARVLGLDERMLSFRGEPIGNQGVAVRMRTLHDERPVLSGSVVAALSEAAWVAMTQSRMESLLGLPGPEVTFEHDPHYGSAIIPAYRVGYELADRFRNVLGFDGMPIDSMRDLLERRLRVPVIQAELGDRIAGATIAAGEKRTIVVNLSGRNRNVYARRMTLAHELSHILFDPRERLRDLRVDEYDELDRREDQIPDPVEQRANAFAVQVLAPRTVARDSYLNGGDNPVAELVHRYGISFTAARYQMWNAMDRSMPITDLSPDNQRVDPAWEGRESYTTSWHPIAVLVDHPSRAGRFSALAIRCAERGLISWDTAAEWLLSEQEQVKPQSVRAAMRDLYPDLFQ